MKKILIFLLIVILLIPVTLWLCPRDPVILMYHFMRLKSETETNQLAITSETFRKQIHWLKAWHYKIYSLDELYQIKIGKKKAQNGVVLTFDDGNRDFYTTVFPIIKNEKVPVASFLICDNLFHQTTGSMSVDEVKSLMRLSSLITFGVHTTHHKALIGMGAEELHAEVTACKEALEQALSIPMYYFAYPGGYLDDESIHEVKKAGFRLAFTTARRRLEGKKEGLDKLVRIKITEKDLNPLRFWIKVSGLWTALKHIKWTIVYHVPPKEDLAKLD